jgi:hypothetical protein
MGSGEGGSQSGSTTRIPTAVRRLRPADTTKAWVDLAPHLPEALYLGGATAVP